mmetsp:Transcript_34519/g.67928  ORF Transcript_34519/g.67928 Transcript_34519/m.67928 type:complete len:246 (-) Transcript_34519:151-888(-)
MAELIFDDDGITLRAAADGILTLRMNRGQNAVNPALITSLSAALDKVDQADHPKSLIITAEGKFFSNGLDLEFMMSNAVGTPIMIESFWKILARILVMDCRTVAAINGHGFGAGLFLALACDFRVMRTSRGYLCWPELNLGMRLAKGFSELSKAKASQATLREGVLTGKRYNSSEALKAGLVDVECPIENLIEEAAEMAVAGLPENLGLANFDPEALKLIKVELYTDAYRALTLGTVATHAHSRL